MHARGNNFTDPCNGKAGLNLDIFNNYCLNNLVNQMKNRINKTGCITVVRRDTQKCCTKHYQTELKRVHAPTYIISTGHIRKVIQYTYTSNTE